MKRIIVLALVLLFVVPSVCFGEQDPRPSGRLSKLGVSEETLNADLAEKVLPNLPFAGFKFFDTLNSMLAALRSGRIAALQADEYTVDYLLSRTKDYAKFRPSGFKGVNLSFSMLLREDEGELCGKISSAIAEMKSDGTLASLKKKYIDDCIAGQDPQAVKPEHFDGAATLRVALTGDRPPMDYVSVAGEPIGFNTALVSEIARRLKMNAEFISVDTGARAAALASKACDVVFWMETGQFKTPDGSINRENVDKEDMPEHTIITEAFLESPLVYVTLSSSPLLQK